MKRVRIGIIGAGGRGTNAFGKIFITEHPEQAAITAIADPNRLRAEAVLGKLGVRAEIYEDYRALLKNKEIDAVIITTPDYLHEEHAIAALRAGKHVLVDKPLAISAAGCLRIIEAARRARRVLYMGFNLRHHVVLHRTKELLAEKRLGEVFSVHAVEYYNGGRTYMARWNRLKKYTGGLFIHKGSHDFDIINWFMQPARPVCVGCFGNVFALKPQGLPFKPRAGVKPGPRCSACAYATECPDVTTMGQDAMFNDKTAQSDRYYKDLCIYLSDKDTHDQGVAIVEYDNGGTAVHTECFVTPITNRFYRLDGTRGHIEADLHANRLEIFPRWSRNRITEQLQPPEGGHGGADPVMCAEFLKCIQKGILPTASGIDGAWSVAVGEACELARAKKRTVRIAEVLDVKSALLKK